MANGWASLGRLLAGGGVDSNKIRAERFSMLADADRRLAEAGIKMDERESRPRLADVLVATGNFNPEDAAAYATALRAGFDPRQITGARGDIQEQGFRGGAVDAARRMYGDDNPNAYLMGVATGPQELAAVQGDVLLGNRFAPGGGYAGPTEIGQGRIGLMGAQAGQAQAGAQENLAQALLYDAKRTNPEKFRAAGRQGASKRTAYQATDPQTGRQITIISDDGQTYLDAQGNLRPLPNDALPMTTAQASNAMQAQRMEGSLADLVASATENPLTPETSRYQESASDVSGPLDIAALKLAPLLNVFGSTFGEDQRKSEVFLNLINEDIKGLVSNNPRYPQWQEKLARGLVAGPALFDEQGEVLKAQELENDILNTITSTQEAFLRTTDSAEKKKIGKELGQWTKIYDRLRKTGTKAPPSAVQRQVEPSLDDPEGLADFWSKQ